MVTLSVIVPVYNTEKYLRECLDSIINQTFRDIEIICVNDGSTDKSLEILKEYALKDNRIKVINQENKGQSIARNVGLNIASGKYITFIDSDDYLDLNTYDTVLSNIENIDIVCFGAKVFGNENTKQKLSDDKYYQIKYDGVIELNDEIRFETDCSVCNKIFKKDVIKKYNINFPIGIHYEDAEFYFKYINVVNQARYINKYFYHYRRRNDSIMSNTFNGCAFAIEHLYIVDNLYNFLQKNSLFNLREDLFARIFTAYFYCAYYRSPDKYKEKVFALAKEYANKFAISSKNSTFTINVLKKGKEKDLTKTPLNFLERIFSIKNDIRRTHKIFTVLGLSIKVKRKKYNNISSKISVIIPVYNVEKYLRECLDSVINQTLKDIEIICVNDGSTDNSLEILKEYEKQDSRIKIIDKKNEGVAAARNDGIRIATGEFVCFIDPDDYYPLVDILEDLYTNAKQNNVYICGGEFSCFTNNDRNLTQNYGDTFEGYLFPENKLIKYSDYQFDYGYHRFIYNKNFLLQNKIFFPKYKRFQDPPFMVNAMITAGNFYALNKITYAYRHGHQVVKWTKEKIYDLLHGILDNLKYADRYHLSKLSEYSENRLMQHWRFIEPMINLKCWFIIGQMRKYNTNIAHFYYENFIKKIINNIFSFRNDDRKLHKVITILGLKFKFKRRRSNAKG